MHALLIGIEGYIDTIHYLFVHDPVAGFIMLSIFASCIAILFQGARMERHRRHVRPHGYDPMGDRAAFSSDSDRMTHGRTSPLFNRQDTAPGERYRGHGQGMGHGRSFWPIFNVDGTPMIPGSHIDIHGNPYGVMSSTSDHFD